MKKTTKTESKLKKIGLPAAYVTTTALIISMFCQYIGACE